jgi:hypothetical protein
MVTGAAVVPAIGSTVRLHCAFSDIQTRSLSHHDSVSAGLWRGWHWSSKDKIIFDVSGPAPSGGLAAKTVQARNRNTVLF